MTPLQIIEALALAGNAEAVSALATAQMEEPLKPNEYRCEMCNGVFEYAWSKEEAMAEKERDFGSVPLDECAVICDDCYQEVRPDQNPEALAAYIDEQRMLYGDPTAPAPRGILSMGESRSVSPSVLRHVQNEVRCLQR